MFDLREKTVANLTIDLTGLEVDESITLTNGTVTNLTVIDKTGVKLTVDSVNLTNKTIN